MIHRSRPVLLSRDTLASRHHSRRDSDRENTSIPPVQTHESLVQKLSEVQQKEKHIYCIPSVLVNNLVLRCFLRDVKVDDLGALSVYWIHVKSELMIHITDYHIQ